MDVARGLRKFAPPRKCPALIRLTSVIYASKAGSALYAVAGLQNGATYTYGLLSIDNCLLGPTDYKHGSFRYSGALQSGA